MNLSPSASEHLVCSWPRQCHAARVTLKRLLGSAARRVLGSVQVLRLLETQRGSDLAFEVQPGQADLRSALNFPPTFPS